ncbi:DUF5710 domain-containing protein [Streptomyces chattanoogensis]|uniref:DUF5710 domain-containing protein n=1 Tax=Streptomyces chattanoogensis TaxID=66876 RepID=UPI0036D03709
MHELHKGAGLPSLATVATELKGAGISRSTIYDAFASTRLPNWHVLDALAEVLATRHPRTTPEQEANFFHALWLLAVDEEDDDTRHEPRNAPEGPHEGSGDHLPIRFTGSAPDLTNAQPATLTPEAAGALVSAAVTHGLERLRERADVIFNRRYEQRIWLRVPYEFKARAKEFGARWDADYKLWFIEELVPELMQYQVPGPHPPQLD